MSKVCILAGLSATLILFTNFSPVSNNSVVGQPNTAKELYAAAGLSQEEALCGSTVTSFRSERTGRTYVAFEGPIDDTEERETWHQWNPCMKALASQANKRIDARDYTAPIFSIIRAQILFVLSRPKVRFYKSKGPKQVIKPGDLLTLNQVVGADDLPRADLFDRVVYVNENDLAYDAFSEADLAYWALQTHKIYARNTRTAPELAPFFFHLGKSIFSHILDEVPEGGLRTRRLCAIGTNRWCSFFHSVTSDDHEQTDGATPNKSYLAVRNLIWAAELVDDLLKKQPGNADLLQFRRRLVRGGIEGTHQLVYGASAIHTTTAGIPPNIFDFVVVNGAGHSINMAWLHYGFSIANKKGYYLKRNPEKNCGYHTQDMKLVAEILQKLEFFQRRNAESQDFEPDLFAGLDLSGFHLRHDWMRGRSIVGQMLKAYDLKIALGFTVDTPVEDPADFSGCSEDDKHLMSVEDLQYLRDVNMRGRPN